MLVFCQTKFRPVRWISSPVNILLTSMKRRRESMWKSVFPVHEFDTEGGNETPVKRATEKAKASRTFSFFPPPHDFLFYADRLRPREAGSLKDDTVNKGRLQPEMRFFFFFSPLHNNYFRGSHERGGRFERANGTDIGASR